jgi:hypothetical protein
MSSNRVMSGKRTTVRLGLAIGALTVGSMVWAQNPQPAQPPQTNCTTKDAQGNPVTDPKCTTPTTPAPATPPPNAAQQFPYPGETTPSADNPNTPLPNAGGLKDAGSSGSSNKPNDSGSSSSSSSSSSSDLNGLGPDPDDKSPLADDPPPEPKRPRRKLPDVPKQTPTERVDEDLKVAQFYADDGNYRGAYLRSKDAVSLADDDPNTHFSLAEFARKLGKLDEAVKEYKRCLELDPIPKQKKASQEALKEMSGS